MTDVTRLLQAATRGDRQAAVELLPLVYDELQKPAVRRMLDPDHSCRGRFDFRR